MSVKVPSDRSVCHMRIGQQDFSWEDERTIIFDDVYPHAVWNYSDEDRVILLLHIKRPGHFPGSLLRESLFATLQ